MLDAEREKLKIIKSRSLNVKSNADLESPEKSEKASSKKKGSSKMKDVKSSLGVIKLLKGASSPPEMNKGKDSPVKGAQLQKGCAVVDVDGSQAM